jgi:hypothetical protein
MLVGMRVSVGRMAVVVVMHQVLRHIGNISREVGAAPPAHSTPPFLRAAAKNRPT